MKELIRKNYLKIVIFAVLVVVLWIFLYWQNNDLVITKYTYKSEKVLDTIDGYKIINLSDLHNKEFGDDNEKLITTVKEEAPNAIVITGDIVDSSSKKIDIAIDVTKKLSEIAPVYYVTGNHEKALNIELYTKLEEGLIDSKVNILNNKTAKINDMLYIVGLDDGELHYENVDKTIDELLDADEVPKNALTILLAHEPQLIDKYTGCDIVFSGHAHGGQIRIPLINKGLVAPDQGILPDYTAGEYFVGTTTMYVSRGLGNSILPFRICNRPDIVELTISKE